VKRSPESAKELLRTVKVEEVIFLGGKIYLSGALKGKRLDN
jgi:hypothetical protein